MKTADGADGGTVELPDAIFGIEPNVAVMHQVVTAQLAAKRAGTHSTKTRSDVRGGGAKPWRQKGTGRARQGSIRAPHWRGGGVAHGPHAARLLATDTQEDGPARVDLGALRPGERVEGHGRRGLEDRRAEDEGRCTAARGGRSATEGRARPARPDGVGRTEEPIWKSVRNLGERVQIVLPEELNTYGVLLNDWIVFSKASLETAVACLGGE